MINNPDGFDDYKNVQGEHVKNFTRDDIKSISNNGKIISSIIPQILCNTFRNAQILSFDDIGIRILTQKSVNLFQFNKNLYLICLNGNKITTIEAGTFANLMIYEINIDDNPLESIAPKAFENCSVRVLTAENGHLKKIDRWFDENTVNVRLLKLTNNQIMEIVDGALINLTDLESFEIDNNNLTEIRTRLFPKKMEHLETISAENNKIKAIDKNFFEVAINIHVLNLFENECVNDNFEENFPFERKKNFLILRPCFENAIAKINQTIKLHLGWR
jgi:Leucine-rich repeat (LRR) protein